MREEEAWALRAPGDSTRAIARRLEVSQTRVVTLLRAVEDRIAADAEAIARRVKARQSCQIEHLLSEVMGAWEQCKNSPRTVRTEAGGDGRTAESVEVRAPASDVPFLAEARALFAAERALWGLGAEAARPRRRGAPRQSPRNQVSPRVGQRSGSLSAVGEAHPSPVGVPRGGTRRRRCAHPVPRLPLR